MNLKKGDGSDHSTPKISIVVGFVIFLMIITMSFGFFIKRRNKTPATAFKKRFQRNDPSPIPAITSEAIIDRGVETQETSQESQRNSTSSIIIEVMTETLSNIIKNQGEFPSDNNSNVSARPEFVRVKTLKFHKVADHSKSGKSSIKNILNIFGKRS
ncbi:12632_t:CDS:1 [Funneliformis geosporum]|uniref:6697_t:CDS:1 n=1 Tax=Funneliformis geosporum TaxID=1117311 RepID=A0A9W4SYZ1_9GLOM|nr:12632_t:CDS:1 [Funneliformis geosporum]CAI2185816.1 6697_t:CDS:1 [Funneliformis geosporum]